MVHLVELTEECMDGPVVLWLQIERSDNNNNKTPNFQKHKEQKHVINDAECGRHVLLLWVNH